MTRTSRARSSAEQFTNRIRQLRKERRLTLQYVADTTGMSVSHLSQIERGFKDLNLQWSRRIGRTFRLLPADLLGQEDGGLTGAERQIIDAYRKSDPGVARAFEALSHSVLRGLDD